jgi:HAD superfamily hydrolase (TIGR01509 family)
MLRGVIFDLDGTLVDSRLDFEAMRREMRLSSKTPLLEAIAALPPDDAARCREILHRHEHEGARRAVPIAGAEWLIAELVRRGLRQAIVTRNSREMAAAMLACFAHAFDPVFTRDDGLVKPDPWAMRETCRRWNVAPAEVVVIGDYRFDIKAGQAAGMRTVLIAPPEDLDARLGDEQADLVLDSLLDRESLVEFLFKVG